MIKFSSKIFKKICLKSAYFSAVVMCFSAFVFSQTIPTPIPPAAPKTSISKKQIDMPQKSTVNKSGVTAEKMIGVSENPNVSLCINQGKIKINGWNRKEIRAVIADGSLVGFKVLKRNNQEEPVWLKVLGYDSDAADEAVFDECLSGDKIEIDLPLNATISIKSGFGGTFDSEINSVAKVNLRNLNGDIVIDGASKGVDVYTLTGNVRVQNSGGAMKINTMSGDVSVYKSQPFEVADFLFAKTMNGAINLQDISHSQMEISSTSGTINFSGNLSTGGQYSFSTQTGAVILNVPRNASFSVNAIYGLGSFKSQFNLESIVKSSNEFQRITGKFGQGDASLNIRTYNGAISLNQLNK